MPGRCGRAVTANTDQVRKTKQKSLTLTKKLKMISVAFQKKTTRPQICVEPLVESSSNFSAGIGFHGSVSAVISVSAAFPLPWDMFSQFDVRRAPSQT